MLLAVNYEEALVPRSPEAGEFFATHKVAEFERRIERRPTLETIDRRAGVLDSGKLPRRWLILDRLTVASMACRGGVTDVLSLPFVRVRERGPAARFFT